MRRSIPVIAASVGVLVVSVALWLRYEFVATGAESLEDLWQELLFAVLLRPLSPFVDRPWAALLPAGVFIGVWLWLRLGFRGSHRWVQITLCSAASAWLLYAVYEWRTDQWERTVTAPIRLDMLLVAPVLELVSLVGFVAVWRGFQAVLRHPLSSPVTA